MPDEKGLFQGLADFSFREMITPQIIKLLYVVLLLAGGVSLVALVIQGMQQSAAQGLLALVFGVIGLFVWALYIRMILELVMVLLRIAANTDRMAGNL